MIDEKKLNQEEQIRAYAEIYARNLIMYGVDVREKLETATQMSYALNQAYMRGKQDGCNSKWIPCSERLPKFTDDYNVTVGVVNEFGYYEMVTTLRYEIVVGKEPKWIIPMDKVYKVIAWCDLPEPYKGE